jgi:hypothetical protein
LLQSLQRLQKLRLQHQLPCLQMPLPLRLLLMLLRRPLKLLLQT